MRNALSMDVSHCFEQFLHQLGCFSFLKLFLFLQFLSNQIKEFPSWTILHDQVHVFIIFISLIVFDNVGRVKFPQKDHFLFELFNKFA